MLTAVISLGYHNVNLFLRLRKVTSAAFIPNWILPQSPKTKASPPFPHDPRRLNNLEHTTQHMKMRCYSLIENLTA